jgi:hypothetical protein
MKCPLAASAAAAINGIATGSGTKAISRASR